MRTIVERTLVTVTVRSKNAPISCEGVPKGSKHRSSNISVMTFIAKIKN